MSDLSPPSFDIRGRVAAITGGYGVLGSAIGRGLAHAGARVAVIGRRADAAQKEADFIARDGGESMALVADVLDREQMLTACDQLIGRWGRVDILVNAAGGNVPRARSDTISVFEIPPDAFDETSGSTVTDFSGNGRTGTLVNATRTTNAATPRRAPDARSRGSSPTAAAATLAPSSGTARSVSGTMA